MRTLMLTLSYDGTGYCGWQIQPNGVSIQAELSRAILAVTGEDARPMAAGRTDAGVHALAQVACWRTASRLAPAVLRKALNANLPEPIVVREVAEAPDDFDPVRDAKGKLYRYVFYDGVVDNPFCRRYAWRTRGGRLDATRMAEAARFLVGTHDFRAFETEWPNRASSVRTIRRCEPYRLGEFIYLDAEADGFLYNMVRAIAGTLYEVGRRKWAPEQVREILEKGDRSLAGPTAPAHGLFLVRVDY